MGAVVALDTSVFIYHFERHADFGAKTERFFRRLDDPADPMRSVCSVLVLLEVMVGPLRAGRADLASV